MVDIAKINRALAAVVIFGSIAACMPDDGGITMADSTVCPVWSGPEDPPNPPGSGPTIPINPPPPPSDPPPADPPSTQPVFSGAGGPPNPPGSGPTMEIVPQ